MQANVKINDLSCTTAGYYLHTQTCSGCSRRECFPEHLAVPWGSSEVQSHAGVVVRSRGGDEVRPHARTLKKNKPQHSLIRPQPEQLLRWDQNSEDKPEHHVSLRGTHSSKRGSQTAVWCVGSQDH